MKNITFSADEKLINDARRQAAAQGKTLNDEFREWLTLKVVTPQQRAIRYRNLMQSLSYVNAGKKFTREEMNER